MRLKQLTIIDMMCLSSKEMEASVPTAPHDLRISACFMCSIFRKYYWLHGIDIIMLRNWRASLVICLLKSMDTTSYISRASLMIRIILLHHSLLMTLKTPCDCLSLPSRVAYSTGTRNNHHLGITLSQSPHAWRSAWCADNSLP